MNETSFLIIYNPSAGKGNAGKRRLDIEKLAVASGRPFELFPTSHSESAGKLILTGYRQGYRHFVICGGDGTVMDALPAILGKKVSLGIVPLGTGNILALNLGIPLRLAAAMGCALHGEPRPIVIGKANGRLFSIAAGIGYDAAVIRDTSSEMKKRFGLFAYLVSAIRNLAHTPHKYAISIDGNPTEIYIAKAVIVANVGKLRGGVIAVPNANPEHAKFKIVIMRPEALGSWIGLVVHALVGRVEKHRSYMLLEGQSVKIRSLSGPQPVECDGNLLPSGRHLNAEVVRETVTIMRPHGK